tara:strand:+ start:1351 stop:1800 length:450 start_codon:yes stop_codon:yes gene_type:complete
MADLIPNKKILQEIVDFLNKGNIFVTRKDKQIIPECINDLPPNIRLSRGDMYKKAYQRLYHRIKKAENPTYKNEARLLALEKKKTSKKVITTPLMLAETMPTPATTRPMKGYKEVARTGRIEAKKLVINMSSTMTCTILNSGLITVDFK